MKIHTVNLIDLLLSKPNHIVEVSLNDGTFNATHFLRFGGRKLFDCGIDSVEVSWGIQDFMSFYSKAYWRIDQIV